MAALLSRLSPLGDQQGCRAVALLLPYLPYGPAQNLGDWRPDTFKNFARLSPLFLQNMTSEVNSFVSD